MPNKIERTSLQTQSLAITASSGTTARIPYRGHAGGMMLITSVTSTPASVSWFVASGPDSTLIPLLDNSGAAVTTTIASTNSYLNAYAIPDEAFGAPFLAAVANTGSINAILNLKS